MSANGMSPKVMLFCATDVQLFFPLVVWMAHCSPRNPAIASVKDIATLVGNTVYLEMLQVS